MNDLTQNLFIYEHFKDIFGNPVEGRFLSQWQYKWAVITNIIPYFNKITEELIDINTVKPENEFQKLLFEAFSNYEKKLIEANRIDYSHQQKIFFDLLEDPQINERIISTIKYVMIDEYQDTNYIQEQIGLKLASLSNNICVVGDEGQALYRFRGATVRNILEFSNHFPKLTQIELFINYRSHKMIINKYNQFMRSINWKNKNGSKNFRFDKTIKENEAGSFPNYPAVYCIWGTNENDEALRFASMIKYLKEHKIIQDYNQVALLLKSVQA